MKSDFLLAITQLAAEKNLPKDIVLTAVESALVSAYRKEHFLPNQELEVKISPTNGKVEVWAEKIVVENVTDERKEVTLEQARKFNSDVNLGDTLFVEATPPNAGRIAAQTAKQVILQRLHEAEHTAIFDEYAGKENDIITGVIQRIEAKYVYINLGRTEAVLPPAEQAPGEKYRIGQRLRVFVVEVTRTPKGPKVLVSRSHPNLLRRLFELEVPEVYNGIVEIKSVAREAGYRSKVAVAARQEGIDPVGCCVGLRGIRIQNIVNELNGEKIDVVSWNKDEKIYIANSLSPAQVVSVDLEEDIADVVVPDKHLSLAIGKDGQNARLAAKLTNWRIDIKSASVAEAEKAEKETQTAAAAQGEVAAKGAVQTEKPEKVEKEEPAEVPAPVAEISETAEETEEAAVETEQAEEQPEEESYEEEEEEFAPVNKEEEEEEEEEPALETELSANFIPRRIMQPKEQGKSQIRFAEDIFINRPSRSGDKSGKKKKKKGQKNRRNAR